MILDKIRNRFQLRLKDRAAAANILGEALKDIIKDEERKKSIVFGIPRGGVAFADIIARKLACQFDIVIPRKLRAPHNEELAIGAVMEDGTTYLNDDIVTTFGISKEYIEREKAIQIQEIKRRTSAYKSPNIDNTYQSSRDCNTIILADDGAATGATLIATARWIRLLQSEHQPSHSRSQRLIIAIPVAPKDTVELFKREADHVEAILTPSTSSFKSVGQYYQTFKTVEDEQVRQIIRDRR